MSKGDVSVAMLVSIAALMAFLVVTLVIVWPVIKTALFDTGDQGECQIALAFTHLKRTGTLGTISQDIPSCKMKRTTVTMGMLDAQKALAKKAVDGLQPSFSAEQIPEYPPGEYGYRKWALQKIIGDEMARCAERGLVGIIDYDPRSITSRQLSSTEMVCLLCTRLTFDKEVLQLFSQEIDSGGIRMKSWLETNAYKGQTYMEKLTTGVPEAIKKETEGAALKRTTTYTVLLVGDTERVGFGDYQLRNIVGLVPYDSLTRDLGLGESGVFVGGARTCGVIIGD